MASDNLAKYSVDDTLSTESSSGPYSSPGTEAHAGVKRSQNRFFHVFFMLIWL